MQMTTCFQRPGSVRLIARLLAFDIRQRARRAARRLGHRRPRRLAVEELRGPDSALARRAELLVRELSPPYLHHHCLRTHAFAVAIAAHTDLRPDPELLYLACLLHDLGFTEPHLGGDDPFELRGARAAYDWCRQQGLAEGRAELVHEAIALHTSLSAARREPEIALVHFGAGVDVLGFRVEDVAPETVEKIVAEWPRLDFKRALVGDIEKEVAKNTDSPVVGQWKLGFGKRVAAAPFAE